MSRMDRTTKAPAMSFDVNGGIITEGIHLLLADSPHYIPVTCTS